MVLIGLFIAGGVLLLARPRVRADAGGIEVRNILVTRTLPWEVVRAVAFPDGASWARLDLPDDEYLAVLAIQAVDGPRAVDAHHARARAARRGDARPETRDRARGGLAPAPPARWWRISPARGGGPHVASGACCAPVNRQIRTTTGDESVRLGDIVLRNRVVTSSSLLGYGVSSSRLCPTA